MKESRWSVAGIDFFFSLYAYLHLNRTLVHDRVGVCVWGGGRQRGFSNESPMQYITHLAFIHSATSRWWFRDSFISFRDVLFLHEDKKIKVGYVGKKLFSKQKVHIYPFS